VTDGCGTMIENHPTKFVCPGCGSDYKVVRVKADSGLPRRLIHCRVCKQPLAARDGELVLKYFLVRRAGARQQENRAARGARLDRWEPCPGAE
jgi:hypothetical protein